jgi:hypothetical protein
MEHSGCDGWPDDGNDFSRRFPMPGKGESGSTVQVALAEFSALRAEIKDRSSLAWTLVNLNLTATTAVAGFALSNKSAYSLLLVLPLISPAFGMLFIDHSLNIRKLGSYIHEHLRSVIVDSTDDERLLRYEEWVRDYETRRALRWVPFGIPLLLLFAGFPLTALVLTYPTTVVSIHPGLGLGWAWTLWAGGLVLVIVNLLLFVVFLINPNFFERPVRPESENRGRSR